jgi:hypothetical protein
MSISTVAISAMANDVAQHFVTNGLIPLAALELVLQGHEPKLVDGFVRMGGTPLEVPGEFAEVTGEHMALVALNIMRLVKPPIEGVCLLASRRNHNSLCRGLWKVVSPYCEIPPALTGALRIQRGDLQRFVANVYGILLRKTCNPNQIETWINRATTTPWWCVVGGPFLKLVSRIAQVAEIQHIQVESGASLLLWGEHGLLITRSDRILLLLLLLFWDPGLVTICASKRPDDMPEPVRTALSATWLGHFSASPHPSSQQ